MGASTTEAVILGKGIGRDSARAEGGKSAMGSHPTQAVGITAFFLSFTALAAAIARGGIILYLAFAVLFLSSIFILRKCKEMEDSES